VYEHLNPGCFRFRDPLDDRGTLELVEASGMFEEVVKCLIDRGAEPYAKDIDGHTPQDCMRLHCNIDESMI
jgi:ankyrin repeat protein